MTTFHNAAVAALAAALCWASAGYAQDAKKDEALDRLLEKLEGTKPADSGPAEAKPDEAKPKDQDEAKAKKDEPKNEAEAAKSDEAKPFAEVEEKDKALDSLLEKLGGREDEPTTEGRPRPSGMPAGPKPEEPDADKAKLQGEEKDLDEHLEELLGRKKKKKDQQQQQQSKPSDENSPLAEAIKKMREVEQRLGKTDTGEQTRQKQAEIVKQLDNILEQLRRAQGQGSGQGQRMTQLVRQAGQNSKGQNQGSQTGTNAGGVGPQKPLKPPTVHIDHRDKNTWGNLPPELRTELENTFREEALPSRAELISRYFLSVNKKSRAKED
ncbi:MAG: hypothetical protein IRY99_06240 [Isosphaeraceae bacterium]|nr:hypothetical protein [Isosphaeraceae bacterium]